MSYILFNGNDSRKYGYIKTLPAPVLAANDYSVTTGMGFDPILYDYGSYSTKSIAFTIGVVGRNRVEEVLKRFTGHGKLMISDHPDRHITAWCMDGITPEKLSNRFIEIPLTYHCYAYSELIKEKEIKVHLNDTSGISIITEYDTNRIGDIPATPLIYFSPATAESTTSISIDGREKVYINSVLSVGTVYCIDTRWSRLTAYGTLTDGKIIEFAESEKTDLTHETYGEFSLLYFPPTVKCNIQYENISFLMLKRRARFLL